MMDIKTVELHFKKPREGVYFIDITRQVEHTIVDSEMNDGIAIIHAHDPNTCITTMEFEEGTIKDMHNTMEKLIPSKERRRLRRKNGKTVVEHNKDVRPSLIGPGITVPFKDNRVMLGKWQEVILMDFDGVDNTKKVVVQMIGE